MRGFVIKPENQASQNQVATQLRWGQLPTLNHAATAPE